MKYCVYGSSTNRIHPDYLAGGEELGRCLARHGHGMVFGGGDKGMMGAAARGIYQIRQELGYESPANVSSAGAGSGSPDTPAGGPTEGPAILGIVPSFFNEAGVLFEHCTEMIFTETMRERKQLMEEKSDGFIITPGGLGTFDEFFEIATLRQLGRHGKPLAILNLRRYYDAMEAMLEKAVEEHFLGEDIMELLRFFREPEELVAWIEKEEEHFLDWRKTKYRKDG